MTFVALRMLMGDRAKYLGIIFGITFATLLLVLRVDEGGFQTIWFVISLLTELAVVLILRTQMPAWRSRPSRLLIWMTVATAIAAFAFPFLGDLARLFSFEPLSGAQLAAIVAIVGGYLLATEAAKHWFYRRRRRHDGRKRRR